MVPYTNEHYYDTRKKIVIQPDQVLPINDTLGINTHAAPLKRLYDEGKMAIIQGIGYPKLEPLALSRHGHLAHLRARQSGQRRLGRAGGSGIGPTG